MQTTKSKGLNKNTLYAVIIAVILLIVAVIVLLPKGPTPTGPVAQARPFHKQILYVIVNDEGTRINMYKTGVFDIAAVTPARWPDVNNTKVGNFTLHLVRRPDKPQLTIQYVGLN
ncbi:MAG: peptide transporter, partial [Thermofilum sp.]